MRSILFSLAVLVVAVGLAASEFTSLGTFDPISLWRSTVLLFVGGFAVTIGSLWAHELAHVIVGRLHGLRPITVTSFPLLARWTPSRWTVRWAVGPSLTLFAPSTLDSERFEVARRRTATAGPAASAGLALAGLLAIYQMLATSVNADQLMFEKYGVWPLVAILALVVNFVAAVVSLSTRQPVVALNDGTVRRILRGPNGVDVVRWLDALRALKFGGRRPRNWTHDEDRSLREGLVLHVDDGDVIHVRLDCGLLLALAYLDHGQRDDALRVLDYMRCTWAESPGADEFIYQQSRVLNAVLVACGGDVAVAIELLGELPPRSPVRMMALHKVAVSIVAAANGDAAGARTAIHQAIRAIDRGLTVVAVAVVERDLALAVQNDFERFRGNPILSSPATAS